MDTSEGVTTITYSRKRNKPPTEQPKEVSPAPPKEDDPSGKPDEPAREESPAPPKEDDPSGKPDEPAKREKRKHRKKHRSPHAATGERSPSKKPRTKSKERGKKKKKHRTKPPKENVAEPESGEDEPDKTRDNLEQPLLAIEPDKPEPDKDIRSDLEDDGEDEEGSASESESEVESGKLNKGRWVTIQVIFYRTYDFNTVAETLDAEVIIHSSWSEPLFDREKDGPRKSLQQEKYKWNPNIYIVNTSKKEPSVMYEKLSLRYRKNGQARVSETKKLRGNFSEAMRLRDFPFDIQGFSLLIQSSKSSEEVSLRGSKHKPHLILRSLYFERQQFRVYQFVDELRPEKSKSKKDDDLLEHNTCCDAIIVKCYAARNPTFYALNCYFMAALICLVCLLSFSNNPRDTLQRNVISFYLVFALFAHKYTLIRHIPKRPYLTNADKYCFAAVVFATLLALWHAFMTQASIAMRTELDWVGAFLFLGLLIAYNIGCWTSTLHGWFKEKKFLKSKEDEFQEKLAVMIEAKKK